VRLRPDAFAVVASRFQLTHPLLWLLGGVAGLGWLVLFGLTAANLKKRKWVALRDQAHVAWALATAWIPVLLIAQLRHTRLRLSSAWWATVFPLGMYASATQATALLLDWPALTIVSLVFFWIALAAWCVVALDVLLTATH
jgi:tellurite resistance protein TehA-like permease